MADVLVVCAHPDDEALFCGGTLARLANNGASIHVIALSDGVSSRSSKGVPVMAMQRRREHFDQACDVLGVHGEIRTVFPDQRSDTIPQITINREVALEVEWHKPMMVFTHFDGDINIDHTLVARAVKLTRRERQFQLYCMAPEWPSLTTVKWEPDIDWPIGDTVEKKARACACYVDELREYPHPRSVQAIRKQTSEQFMEIR